MDSLEMNGGDVGDGYDQPEMEIGDFFVDSFERDENDLTPDTTSPVVLEEGNENGAYETSNMAEFEPLEPLDFDISAVQPFEMSINPGFLLSSGPESTSNTEMATAENPNPEFELIRDSSGGPGQAAATNLLREAEELQGGLARRFSTGSRAGTPSEGPFRSMNTIGKSGNINVRSIRTRSMNRSGSVSEGRLVGLGSASYLSGNTVVTTMTTPTSTQETPPQGTSNFLPASSNTPGSAVATPNSFRGSLNTTALTTGSFLPLPKVPIARLGSAQKTPTRSKTPESTPEGNETRQQESTVTTRPPSAPSATPIPQVTQTTQVTTTNTLLHRQESTGVLAERDGVVVVGVDSPMIKPQAATTPNSVPGPPPPPAVAPPPISTTTHPPAILMRKMGRPRRKPKPVVLQPSPRVPYPMMAGDHQPMHPGMFLPISGDPHRPDSEFPGPGPVMAEIPGAYFEHQMARLRWELQEANARCKSLEERSKLQEREIAALKAERDMFRTMVEVDKGRSSKPPTLETTVTAPSSTQSRPTSTQPRAEIDSEADDEVMITYAKGPQTAYLPHARSDCSIYEFMKREPHEGAENGNVVFCENCYCYICDTKASECNKWSNFVHPHSNAYANSAGWVLIRQDLKAVRTNPILQVLSAAGSLDLARQAAGVTAYLNQLVEGQKKYNTSEFDARRECFCGCHSNRMHADRFCGVCEKRHYMYGSFNEVIGAVEVAEAKVRDLVEEEKYASAIVLLDAISGWFMNNVWIRYCEYADPADNIVSESAHKRKLEQLDLLWCELLVTEFPTRKPGVAVWEAMVIPSALSAIRTRLEKLQSTETKGRHTRTAFSRTLGLTDEHLVEISNVLTTGRPDEPTFMEPEPIQKLRLDTLEKQQRWQHALNYATFMGITTRIPVILVKLRKIREAVSQCKADMSEEELLHIAEVIAETDSEATPQAASSGGNKSWGAAGTTRSRRHLFRPIAPPSGGGGRVHTIGGSLGSSLSTEDSPISHYEKLSMALSVLYKAFEKHDSPPRTMRFYERMVEYSCGLLSAEQSQLRRNAVSGDSLETIRSRAYCLAKEPFLYTVLGAGWPNSEDQNTVAVLRVELCLALILGVFKDSGEAIVELAKHFNSNNDRESFFYLLDAYSLEAPSRATPEQVHLCSHIIDYTAAYVIPHMPLPNPHVNALVSKYTGRSSLQAALHMAVALLKHNDEELALATAEKMLALLRMGGRSSAVFVELQEVFAPLAQKMRKTALFLGLWEASFCANPCWERLCAVESACTPEQWATKGPELLNKAITSNDTPWVMSFELLLRCGHVGRAIEHIRGPAHPSTLEEVSRVLAAAFHPESRPIVSMDSTGRRGQPPSKKQKKNAQNTRSETERQIVSGVQVLFRLEDWITDIARTHVWEQGDAVGRAFHHLLNVDAAFTIRIAHQLAEEMVTEVESKATNRVRRDGFVGWLAHVKDLLLMAGQGVKWELFISSVLDRVRRKKPIVQAITDHPTIGMQLPRPVLAPAPIPPSPGANQWPEHQALTPSSPALTASPVTTGAFQTPRSESILSDQPRRGSLGGRQSVALGERGSIGTFISISGNSTGGSPTTRSLTTGGLADRLVSVSQIGPGNRPGSPKTHSMVSQTTTFSASNPSPLSLHNTTSSPTPPLLRSNSNTGILPSPLGGVPSRGFIPLTAGTIAAGASRIRQSPVISVKNESQQVSGGNDDEGMLKCIVDSPEYPGSPTVTTISPMDMHR